MQNGVMHGVVGGMIKYFVKTSVAVIHYISFLFSLLDLLSFLESLSKASSVGQLLSLVITSLWLEPFVTSCVISIISIVTGIIMEVEGSVPSVLRPLFYMLQHIPES